MHVVAACDRKGEKKATETTAVRLQWGGEILSGDNYVNRAAFPRCLLVTRQQLSRLTAMYSRGCVTLEFLKRPGLRAETTGEHPGFSRLVQSDSIGFSLISTIATKVRIKMRITAQNFIAQSGQRWLPMCLKRNKKRNALGKSVYLFDVRQLHTCDKWWNRM